MQISLRKANALQHEIRARIDAKEYAPILEVNAFDDPVQRALDAASSWSEDRQLAGKLRDAYFDIRKAVSAANHVSGLNDILADTARVDDRIRATKRALEPKARPTDEVLEGTRKKLHDNDGRNAMFADAYNKAEFGALSQEGRDALEAELANLNKEKRGLKDKALEINVESKIELSQETAELLQKHAIL